MQAIETLGLWWLPEAPDKKWFGTLSCSEAGEIHLTITGGRWESALSFEQTYPTILGEIDRKEQKVTLKDCLLSKQTHSANPLSNRQEFFAHRGFLGAHLTKGDDLAFSGAGVSFPALNAWAQSLTGFSEKDQGFSVVWHQPKQITGGIPGGTFILGVDGCSSNTLREKRLKEDVKINFTFAQPVPEQELQANFIYPLQNFLTFASDHPNALTKLQVTRKLLPNEEISVIGPATFADETQAADLMPLQMLFTLADIESRLEQVLRRWLDLSKEFSEVLLMYFGSIYRPPGYIDLRFSLMMHVLALYQARRGKPMDISTSIGCLVKALASRAPAELMANLHGLLKAHPLVGAERALATLMKEHQNEFTPLVAGKNGHGIDRFETYVLNTLHYMLTREPGDGFFASAGADLYWLTELMAFLFKIALLKELGFPPDQVRTLLDRNPRYQHICKNIQPQAPWLQSVGK